MILLQITQQPLQSLLLQSQMLLYQLLQLLYQLLLYQLLLYQLLLYQLLLNQLLLHSHTYYHMNKKQEPLLHKLRKKELPSSFLIIYV